MTKGRQSIGSSKAHGLASPKGSTSAAAGKSTSASAGAIVEGDGDGEAADEDDLLMASIRRHNDAFTSLLSLIPAQYYVAPESEDSSEVFDISLAAKKKRKQEKTLGQAEKKAAAKEAKRARLDPDNFRSAAEVQREREAAKGVTADEMDLDFDTGSPAGDTDSDADSEDDDNGSAETQLTSVKGSDDASEKPVTNAPANTGILDLRARLQAKIQGMQAKRKMAPSSMNGADGEDDESVASTKDELLEERRRKRGEMRDKRRRAMKERRKTEKAQIKDNSSSGNNKKGAKAPALLVSDRAATAASSSKGPEVPPSDIAFSSIQFGDDDTKKGKKSKHALPSDPKAALAIIEARKKKEEARAAKRAGDAAHLDEKGKSIADAERKEREKWSKAEAAAQGIKIRDDENLLKKAAKKKDKIKEKSRKEWTDRDRELKEQAAARQKKRNDNIAERKASSKKGGSKGKKAGGGKKPKARAGFEGKARHPKFNGKPKSSKAHK